MRQQLQTSHTLRRVPLLAAICLSQSPHHQTKRRIQQVTEKEVENIQDSASCPSSRGVGGVSVDVRYMFDT